MQTIFANPWFFALLLLLPIIGIWYWYKNEERYVAVQFSEAGAFTPKNRPLRVKLRHSLWILRGLAITALIVALARPQLAIQEQNIKAEGIDIVLAMDLSSSMLAQDFRPDRLSAAKRVAMEFVDRREYDRIGLVLFSGEAYTQCPVTADHAVVNDFLSKLKCGILEDGTAIGMGLATAVNRLKDSPSKSKIIILLTDGVNNAGYVQPITAAEIAKEIGVKVYTIGVGTQGEAYAPVGRRPDGEYVFSYVPVEIDENLMMQVSQSTGGRYFRAVDEKSLQRIYNEIDKLEKTEIDITTVNRQLDVFGFWLKWALLFLMLEFALRNTVFRSVV